MRVLVVARWYPSHDAPHRGGFVADLVEAVHRKGGVEQVVASWEPALVRGPVEARSERLQQAETVWRSVVTEPAILNRPVGWGARGVPVARLRELDDPTRRSPGESVERHAALLLPFALELTRRRPIDLVHAHTGIPDGLAAARVAERLGVPLVVTEHASDVEATLGADPVLAAAYRELATAPDRRLLAVSGPFAARIAAASGLDPDRITVLPNTLPMERFPLSPAAGRDPDELLWVGARGEKKGTDVLLRAFARVHTERPGTRLRLVGGSGGAEPQEPWPALAAELGLAEVVSFEPAADRDGVARAMGRAGIFVHPSPAETFGIVAAEALATGLPVAATRSGGVEAILGSSGRFGELAEGTDAEGLAAAVIRLLDRRAELDPAAMRRHVEAQFGALGVARRMLAIYKELLAGAARPATGAPADADQDSPEETRADATPLIVALSRPLLAARLAALTAVAPRGLTVVTTVARDGEGAPTTPDGVRLVEVDPDADHRVAMRAVAGPSLAGIPEPARKVLRFALAPRAALRRRRLFAERPRMRRATLQTATLEAWRAHRDRAGAAEAAWLVACDAEDVDAAVQAIAAGARLAPGGLRWLADRWSIGAYHGGRAEQ